METLRTDLINIIRKYGVDSDCNQQAGVVADTLIGHINNIIYKKQQWDFVTGSYESSIDTPGYYPYGNATVPVESETLNWTMPSGSDVQWEYTNKE